MSPLGRKVLSGGEFPPHLAPSSLPNLKLIPSVSRTFGAIFAPRLHSPRYSLVPRPPLTAVQLRSSITRHPASGSHLEDVEMESATTRDIAKALKDIAARLPVPLGGVERVVDEAKAKLAAATSDVGIVTVFPHQFQSDVREYLRGYCTEVEALASARSSLSKLRKHRHAKSYPAALNSIKVPSIQFLRAFVNAPATEGHRGSYNTASGTGRVLFEPTVESAVKAMKDEVLKNWTSKKDKEVTFLERKASVATALAGLEDVVHAKHTQLVARYDYLDGTSAHDNVVVDVNAAAAISLALAMTVITKVNSLVLDEEDKWLEIAIKKMTLVKPVAAAGAQAATNDMSELKKMVGDLAKKIDLQGRKVHDSLYPLLCYCAGHLSLTAPLLETLLTGIVKAGWEEVGREEQEGEGKERQGRHYRKEKGRQGPSRHGRKVQGKRQGQGRRTRCEVKAAGQQEEGWQEVSAAFGLCFGTDSASASPLSTFGLFLFFDVYGLDWTLFSGPCRFLCMSLPPVSLLDPCLRPLVQICCLAFVFSTSTPKFNYFDYTTYLDLVVKVEQDLLFMVMSRFAPKWLLGSCRFTNRLHSNLDIDVPKIVVDTFLAGGKYLSPIVIKKSLVRSCGL